MSLPSITTFSGLLSGSLLHWQPVADLENGRIIGMEALLRPETGTPTSMLSEIDKTNRWEIFTKWEMERIIEDLVRISPIARSLFVFFNLSPKQCISEWVLPTLLAFPDFAAPVIEITEEAATEEHLKQLDLMRRKAGALIAIDDFGTGYSNVDRLLDLPVDFVKIDRKLIQTTSGPDQRLVEGVIRGIRTMDVPLLGEGIENEIHARFARDIGCLTGQGWHFGRPMPIGKLGALLASKGIHSAKWGLEPG
ncbi:EAL domain-containing protein [Leptospirillum ferriphilum]|uniref:EAL domain-containing protein n=1 Tax=Leptospirillum ferriphilum TaxID=178606 RepID=UPI0006B22353|nr:EAL domain-containing protein [Leptospirillum ferriphilum]